MHGPADLALAPRRRLASADKLKATLAGPAIAPQSAPYAWNSTDRAFRAASRHDEPRPGGSHSVVIADKGQIWADNAASSPQFGNV